MKVLADLSDYSLRIQLVGKLVGPSHIAVEVEVVLDIADAEMMTQIAREHSPCSRLVHLFLLAKQGEQTQKTGEDDIIHFLLTFARRCALHYVFSRQMYRFILTRPSVLKLKNLKRPLFSVASKLKGEWSYGRTCLLVDFVASIDGSACLWSQGISCLLIRAATYIR